jgi:hypothetical protein
LLHFNSISINPSRSFSTWKVTNKSIWSNAFTWETTFFSTTIRKKEKGFHFCFGERDDKQKWKHVTENLTNDVY